MLVTLLLVSGSLGEGNPSNPADRIQFRGHVVPHPGAAVLLVAAACLALAWRRRYPVAVLVVSAAAVSAYSLLGYVNGASLVAPVLALYAVATQVSVRQSVIAAVATLAVLLTVTAANNPFGHITGGGFDIIPFMVAAALFAGIAVANRQAYVASIQDRAEQDARRRVDEERLRIARELHDVVAHTMATINVQAGVASHVLSTRPEAAAESLLAIKAASKDGLRELRAILNVLRQADDADPTQPVPGTAQLETLIAGARRAGLDTTLTVTGEPGPAAGRRGPGRLPHRPGVADQRHPARRPGHRRGLARLRPRRAADRRDRHRPRPGHGPGRPGRGPGRRARPGRHARTRGHSGREAGDRPRPGGRLPGRGPAAPQRHPHRRQGRGMAMIRVLLADDQALIRAGFHVLIDAADDLQVVGEALDGAQAVDLARRERADVVLMDIRMPGVDGLEATRRISADDDLAGVKVIILTTFESDEYVYQAIRSGASGFLVKDTEPADLLQAIRVVARGDALLSPSVTRRLITDLATRPERPPPSDRSLTGLTEREREVLALVAEGLSNDEIAARLFLSPLTAKTHVSRIMTKLNARDRAQLVVMAYETRPGHPRRAPPQSLTVLSAAA